MAKDNQQAIKDGAKKSGSKPNSFVAFTQYVQLSLISTIQTQADMIKDLRRNLKILYALLALAMIVISAMALKGDPEAKYFGRDEKGNFTKLVPLSQAKVNAIEARLWAETCIIDSLELSFLNPIRRVNTILGKCFDDDGQLSYKKWLFQGNKKNTVEIQGEHSAGQIPADSEMGLIVRKRISMTASPKAPGRLNKINSITNSKGKEIARWELTMPVIIRKEAGDDNSGVGNVVVKVTLTRTDSESFPKGIAISTWYIAVGG